MVILFANIKKRLPKLELLDSLMFFHVITVRYSGMIASLGQTPAQVPQSMQVLGSIT